MSLHTEASGPSLPRWDPPTGWSHGTPAEDGTETPVRRDDATQGWRVWSPAQDWEVKWPVICRHYTVLRTGKTGAFALERHYVLDVLLDAYPRLRSLFDEAPEFRLEGVADPDVAHRRYLKVSIITDLPVAEALSRMDRFTDDWWLDHIARAGRDLVFIVEFSCHSIGRNTSG